MQKQHKKNIDTSESSIDFTEILYTYTRQWKLFVLSIIVCMAIGVVVMMTTPIQYSTSLSILLNEDKGKTGGSLQGGMNMESLGVISTTSNIDNEITILSSPDLIEGVVDSLNLQVSYYVRKGFRWVEIYEQRPFSIHCYNTQGNIELDIEKKGDTYDLTGTLHNGDEKINLKHTDLSFPTIIELPGGLGSLDIKPNDTISQITAVKVKITTVQAATRFVTSSLSVTSPNRNSSVLNVGLHVGNTNKGAAILKELVKQYNALNVRVNNELSYSTALFINDRLAEISNELDDVERQVVGYKQQYKITDLNSEAQMFVQQTSSTEQKIIDADTQLSVLSLIEKFITSETNKYALIPNIEISDQGLSQIITLYNTKLLANEQLIKNTGDDNPSRKRVLEDIDNTRNNIISSLKNLKQTYQVVRNSLQKQTHSIQNRIEAVPQQQKGLLEKVRLQQVKESLFLYLMQKREETAISIASTADKARIVVSPTYQANQTVPKSMNILIAALIIGIVLPVGYIYIRELLKTKISGQSDLEKLSRVNIIGQICKNTSSDYIVIHKNDVTPIAEMFRSIRNNINFIFKHQTNKIILVTSTMSGEGKTFFSLNLALSFSLLDLKVLLIGADIRNPKLKSYINLDGKVGLTDYLISETDNWKEYINSLPDSNLDVLISGTIPPNPNELLTSAKLRDLFAKVKNEYDLVILDTAPVGLVSDTYLMDKYADLTLYVTRENVTEKSSVEFINKQAEEESLHNMYLILNDTDINNKYGYRYGYGKGYGYGSKNK